MTSSRSFPARGRTYALIFLLWSAACASWRPAPLTPELVARDPAKLRVVRLDGSRVVLDGPELRGDTLIGTDHGREIAIPRDSVRQAATREFSSSKSLVLVASVLGVLALTAAFINAIVNGTQN